MKGKISKIWINKLDDGRTYATLMIGGRKYTTWDQSHYQSLKKGDVIDFDYKKAGNFKNIKSLSVIGEEKPTNDPFQQYINEYGPDLDLIKNREIVRMSCLKSAIYATGDLSELDIDERAETTIEIAKRFEQYITDFEYLLKKRKDD